MAEKRRDNKGRILRTGESQRKDGRYAYKYTDSTGKPQFVYAWKLVATDKTPTGKRDDKSGYYIETPKTKSGYREIPMSEPVYQALKRVVKNRGKKTTIMIDGYTNFLFLKRDGTPKVGMDYNNMIRNLLKKYNKQHKEPLPNITPHSFRHTFCTRMANAGMNPKALQYIMGHANITMTLDYYTHVDACSVRAEMERLAA